MRKISDILLKVQTNLTLDPDLIMGMVNEEGRSDESLVRLKRKDFLRKTKFLVLMRIMTLNHI